MDRDDPVDDPPFRWPDQPMMGDPDGMQGARQLAFPKAQKTPQRGEIGGEIIVLPDVKLEQARMVGQMIMDLGSGQAIAIHLPAEVTALHLVLQAAETQTLRHMTVPLQYEKVNKLFTVKFLAAERKTADNSASSPR